MRFTKVLVILCAVLLVCNFASAKLYWDPPQGQGTSTVGIGGDYPNLGTAIADFNTTAPTGNWTIEILSDLTEPDNIAMANTTGAFAVTIKPAAGVTAKVTFTATYDNVGWSGSFIIGCNQKVNLNDGFYWTKVIIDGSNNGTTSRDLSFEWPSYYGQVVPPSGNGYPAGIHLAGAAKDCVIKNVNMKFLVVNQAAPGVAVGNACYVVRVTARRTTTAAIPGGAQDYIPSNPTIQNCDIYSYGTRLGYGIGCTLSTATAFAGAQKAIRNLLIEDCTVEASHRTIFLNCNSSFIIRNNTIRTHYKDEAGGYESSPIDCTNSNGDATPWTSYIYNNIIDKIQSNCNVAAAGISGMKLTGAPAAAGSKYVVYNNLISGFNLTNAASGDYIYRGVVTGSSYAQMEIYNNTFLMPEITKATGATLNRVAAFCTTSTNLNNNYIVKNNIVQFGNSAGTAKVVYKANTVVPTCDNNVYIAPLTSSGNFAQVSATTYTYAAWKGIQDANSKTDDVLSLLANNGFVKTTVDSSILKFGATGGAIPTADIDGDPQTTPPYVGFDVPSANDSYIFINSAQASVPPAGYNAVRIGETKTVSAPDITAGTTKYVCTGWTGSGDAEVAAGGAVNTLTYTNDADSTMTWNWKTQYQLATAVAPAAAVTAGCSVTPATGGWYDSGTPVVCTFIPASSDWVFANWSGGLTSSTNPDTVTMDAAKTVTANVIWADYTAISSSPVAFGTKLLKAFGGVDANQEFVIKNDGTSKLDITGATPVGSADFSITNLPISLDPGTTAGLNIRYSPNTVGPQSTVFTLTENAPLDGPVTIVATGNGLGAQFEYVYASDAYTSGDLALSEQVSNSDILEGKVGTGGVFHPATVGDATNLTNGAWDTNGLTVIMADEPGAPTGNPSCTIEYVLTNATIDKIVIFAGHDSQGSRAFINCKVETKDIGGTWTQVGGNLTTGAFGTLVPGQPAVSLVKFESAGMVTGAYGIRFSFYRVNNPFDPPPDIFDPPSNGINGTIVKEIDVFGEDKVSVDDWSLLK